MMTKPTPEQTILQHAQAHGYTATLAWLLEWGEPLAPLAAQSLWVVQPLARLWGVNVQPWATLLEEPQGVTRLRHVLHDALRQEG